MSAERGTMITMCAIINALGNTIPPVFIFPRARVHDSMTMGAPPGRLSLANSPKSGWMISSLFLKTLKHIKKQNTRCSISDPILLLMGNHESHCNLEAIMYVKSNGIILLTFPPHTTPGKPIKIHDLLAIINTAYEVPKPGIWPFSRNAFKEQDYEAAIVTEQPHLDESPVAEEHLSNFANQI